ncbi:MAG: UDP-2,3-diacylglucosamine diphosphatase [Gemmatimonadetes bacterium]|nr:UDP-2,3-diacylglucosamine diphosphatase [Gemmatimonadota bacterium]
MTALEAPTPAFFFSDVHLGAADPGQESLKNARLAEFLDHVGAAGRSLFCLGDLFDFWFEYDTAVPARFFGVLRRLQELSEAGVRLHFQGGNHDWWVRRGGRPGFLEREIGFRLLPDRAEIAADGLRLLLLHGDGIGRGDVPYRVLKRVLRNRLAVEAFRWIHPDLAARVGSLTSRTSRRAKGSGPREETCAAIRAHALETLAHRPDLHAVLAGHAHRLEETAIADGRRYLNLGDWRSSGSYAVIQGGALSLRSLGVTPLPHARPPRHPDPPQERSSPRAGTAREGR